MNKKTNDNLVLHFREESVSNIAYEASKDFETSIFREAYGQAYKITQEIIYKNRFFYDKLSTCEWNGTDRRNREQFFNIIAFVGERGAGKTSVMLSYMEFLKDYYRNLHCGRADETLKTMSFVDESGNKTELMFTGLEYIDASLLGSNNDDILRNVLPKMLKKLQSEEKKSYRDGGIIRDEDYSYKRRQLQMSFNNVYKNLKNMNSKQDILETDSDLFMETLEKLSLIWNLREAFQNLVKDYLDLMEYSGSENKVGKNNHYLVISLDDLDMNMEHGFELLEEVRKYLMVPNVIVLLSASYKQLEKLCINHYMKHMEDAKAEENAKEYITKLSGEYLRKILPSHCRVALEPVKKWDSYEKSAIQIEYARLGEKSVDCVEGTLKQIISEKYLRYFCINFLKHGKCLNYCMPSSIRELAFWIKRIYSLKPFLEKQLYNTFPMMKKTYSSHEVYRRNMHVFWEKIFPEICEKHLLASDREFFGIIEEMDIEGQLAMIDSRNIKRLSYASTKEGNFLLDRLNKGLSGTLEERRFCAVSIIYLTARLTERLVEWNVEKSENRREALMDIRSIFKRGIWGDWEREMSGKLAFSSGQYGWIARTDFRKLNRCLDMELGSLGSCYDEKKSKKISEKYKKSLMNYQRLLFFFDFPSNFSFSEMQFEIDENGYRIQVEPEGLNDAKTYEGSFALSYIMRYWEDKREVVEDFVEKVLEKLHIDKKEASYESVKKEISIFEEGNPYIVFPVENVEFLLNVGQTLQNAFENDAVNDFSKNIIELEKEIRGYFSVIGTSLAEYDALNHTKYKEKFDETEIGIELRSGEIGKEIDLFHMLAVSVSRVSVPIRVSLFD